MFVSIEKIQTYESITSSQSKEISSLDSLAHVLGSQEHCGRVRGLGLGPCPSKVFGVHAHSHVGSSSSTPSNVELQSQVSSLTSSNVKLESQVSSLTSQVNEMKAIMTLLLQNHQGPLPSQFTVFQRSSGFVEFSQLKVRLKGSCELFSQVTLRVAMRVVSHSELSRITSPCRECLLFGSFVVRAGALCE
ncbi:uncharacterized protein LOC128195192 [Vigna angularis]|uniref:uncharacterized protein LOC128195192 n=1 Tax=Phaseolus angularis TaxID=3914 RepID=UPI0022B31B78|nr:uncharacterized protein LOC128195192 [Vigna angularis]